MCCQAWLSDGVRAGQLLHGAFIHERPRLRQAQISNTRFVTQIATQLFATRWQFGGIATFIVATKKEPQAEYALGVLVD
jgi:hypothetical protein